MTLKMQNCEEFKVLFRAIRICFIACQKVRAHKVQLCVYVFDLALLTHSHRLYCLISLSLSFSGHINACFVIRSESFHFHFVVASVLPAPFAGTASTATATACFAASAAAP